MTPSSGSSQRCNACDLSSGFFTAASRTRNQNCSPDFSMLLPSASRGAHGLSWCHLRLSPVAALIGSTPSRPLRPWRLRMALWPEDKLLRGNDWAQINRLGTHGRGTRYSWRLVTGLTPRLLQSRPSEAALSFRSFWARRCTLRSRLSDPIFLL